MDVYRAHGYGRRRMRNVALPDELCAIGKLCRYSDRLIGVDNRDNLYIGIDICNGLEEKDRRG